MSPTAHGEHRARTGRSAGGSSGASVVVLRGVRCPWTAVLILRAPQHRRPESPKRAPCHALQGHECGAACVDQAYDLAAFGHGWRQHRPEDVGEAVEQRDAADEGRLDAYGIIIVGKVIVNGARSVRPSQLITSVRRLLGCESGAR